MGRAVAIMGTGQTHHGKRFDVSYPELVREAVQRAFEDSGLSPEDVDAVVTGTMPSMMEGIALNHLYLADAIQVVGKPLLKTETCGSTGMSVAHTAFYWVAAGLADVVLAVGFEKMYEGDSQATMTTVADPWIQRSFVAGAPGIFAMQSNMWIDRHHIPAERLREAAAVISLRNHDDAFDNPYAHIKARISLEEIKDSRIVTYPIRRWDVCPNSDGACAVLFMSEHKAKQMANPPAWIKGVGYRGDESYLGDSDKVRWNTAIDAAKEAYHQAGIVNPRRELDVAEVYNPFTFMELLLYECFGFCDFGEACDLALQGTFSRGGDLPCDPSGGVLCTNPIGATGLIRVAEAAMQVTGKAGAHQVDGAQLALAHAMGGVSQFNGIMIVGSQQ
ncbi:MAG: acetyl-CoA acetyltransferase [Sulfobacillus acidophilus]|uniref:Acetyl-CoA acetyltransferase n=1 Tax=Sulfobacillus acidophilus TaxID=53633 RepID=A0A2T2WLU8_9FIRM|nr:MAG: acetyl-CoA acetyltransferase [Sulfobacillus acidophilus]